MPALTPERPEDENQNQQDVNNIDAADDIESDLEGRYVKIVFSLPEGVSVDLNFLDETVELFEGGDDQFPTNEDLELAKAFEESEALGESAEEIKELEELKEAGAVGDLGFAKFIASPGRQQNKALLETEVDDLDAIAEELEKTLPPQIDREEYIDMYIGMARLINALEVSRMELQNKLIQVRFHDDSLLKFFLQNQQDLMDFYTGLF
jgi:hypothetical protein